MLKDDAAMTPYVSDAPIFGLMFMNSQEGYLAGNYGMRQAILAALNMTEALQVSVGDEELWDAQGSFFPEGSIWYSEAGTERYSEGDVEKAAQMAKDAGYDGTPITLLVSTNYQQHFDQANVFKRQLADAGIEVELNVTDWATLLKERGEPQSWDLFMTHHGPAPDPVLLTFMNDSYPGWWTSPEKEALAATLNGSTDPAVREETWAAIQELVYEQIPAVKVGDVFSFDLGSPQLQTAWDRAPAFPYFWGATK
jgi:peptide/nickel transport system substrate-binding protein